jgi:cyanate permease
MMERTQWRLSLIALTTGVIAATNVGKVPIALPYIRDTLQLTLLQVGWFASTFNIIAMLMGVFFGLLVRYSGALRACLLGHVFIIIGGVMGAISQDLITLFLSRFIEGMGFISIVVSAPTLISATSTLNDRRLLLSSWSVYMPLGVTIAAIIAPMILSNSNWRVMWVMIVVLVSLSALTLWFAFRRISNKFLPNQLTHTSTAMQNLRDVLKIPSAWLYSASFGLYTLQFWVVYTWLPTFLREERNLDSSTIAILSGLFMIVHMPGTIFTGKLLQKGFSRGNLIILTHTLMILASIGMFTGALPDIVRYICCLFLAFVGGLIPASVLSATTVLARNPAQIASMQGLFIQGSNLGQFISPLFVSMLISATGTWENSIFITIPTAIVGIFVGLALRRLQ